MGFIRKGNQPVIGQRYDWCGLPHEKPLGELIARGWCLCDGNHGTPDLINRFQRYGNELDVLAVGGADSVPPAGTISITVDNHTLTVDQMPAHGHGIAKSNTQIGQGYDNGFPPGAFPGRNGTLTSSSTGGGQAHNHGASSVFTGSHHDNRPAFVNVVPLMFMGMGGIVWHWEGDRVLGINQTISYTFSLPARVNSSASFLFLHNDLENNTYFSVNGGARVGPFAGRDNATEYKLFNGEGLIAGLNTLSVFNPPAERDDEGRIYKIMIRDIAK